MTKEEEILKAAEEEFFINGYDACSTAVIAKRAGVTHAMVNYYFRTKEKLFVRIFDTHVEELLRCLKPIMQDSGDVVSVAINAACIIFDRLDSDRKFPYILSDISRTHPDFLMKYRETFDNVCMDSVRLHSVRLGKCIAAGQASQCTMNDIYNTVLSLSFSPFLVLPILENVAGLPQDKIEKYLKDRRAEMVKVLRARYSAS